MKNYRQSSKTKFNVYYFVFCRFFHLKVRSCNSFPVFLTSFFLFLVRKTTQVEVTHARRQAVLQKNSSGHHQRRRRLCCGPRPSTEGAEESDEQCHVKGAGDNGRLEIVTEETSTDAGTQSSRRGPPCSSRSWPPWLGHIEAARNGAQDATWNAARAGELGDGHGWGSG